MLREFAVEPALFAGWDACRFFSATFGVEHGRLIARFPGKWRDMVGEALTPLHPIERARIVTKLKALRTCMVEGDRPYADSLDWLQNAEETHESNKFHAIVASGNPRAHERVIAFADIDVDHPLFACERTCRMERTPKEFCRVAGPLLAMASDVVFVEPHFFKRSVSASDRWTRWTDTLEALVGCIRKPLLRLELFTSMSPQEDASVANLFQTKLPEHIPEGMALDVHFLTNNVARPDADTHNRYILTNRGGLIFPWGLDALPSGAPDTVSLLSMSITSSLLGEYDKFRTHDKLVHVTVQGTKSR